MQGLLAGRDVLISTALTTEQVLKDQELAKDLGLSPSQLGRQLAQSLGIVTHRLLSMTKIAGLVVAGGETAAAVCHGFPSETLELIGAPFPTIPLLRLPGSNLRIITKSGGFGSEHTLKDLMDYLRHTELVA
jgi:uncharacterized protein YgbK (DUF1537 family)